MMFDSRCSRPRRLLRAADGALGRAKMCFWLQALCIALILVQTCGANSDWENCGVCYCNWNSGKKTADCKSKALITIPRNLSTELQAVDLSNNIIPELRRDEFLDANLQNLHKIFMRNCTLQELNRDAFKGLAILIELDLSQNFIRQLHPGTFAGLEKLRNVVMNNNEIEVLDNYIFAELDYLSRVEFKHNRLKRIEVHAFVHLPILSAVYLEANELTVLRKETFSLTPKLLHLSLAQNPWNCTCELHEFRDFALTHRLYTPPTACYEPRHLRGKLWSEVPSESFACQPRILGPSHSYVETQADNATLQCRIGGSPRPNVTWIYNKRPINPNDSRFKVYNSIEQNYMDHTSVFTSELRIYDVRSADRGSYTCVADNRGGKAEADIQLIVNGNYIGAIDAADTNAPGSSAAGTQSEMLLVVCLVATTLLLLLIVAVLAVCWYFRRIKVCKKDSTMMSENGLLSSKMDKTRNGSLLEGSVIMEMQKSLLNNVNPVEKPPRRPELEKTDNNEDGHEIKKTLLDEANPGNHNRDDETQSVALSDTTPRSRHTYVDDGYGTSLPPDLLAFPAHVPPTSPSIQSSQSNIPDHAVYGPRSPISSPVYAHMTPHSIYDTTAVTAATPSGFMTLQHPSKRNLALLAAANSRQQQSPFVPAPVVYAPTTTVIMKQGYMTIPRKPRVPSWTPSSGAHTTQFSEFQSPISPNLSETDTTNAPELCEPVYDNLGLRTTAGGNSTLNLHKNIQEPPVRYTMRDRPLPATPASTVTTSSGIYHSQQQTATKIYEAAHNTSATSDTEPLYGTARQHTLLSNLGGHISGIGRAGENKATKIPPRPPPKPKKKMSMTTTRCGQSSTSQLFEDEGEDGTEV